MSSEIPFNDQQKQAIKALADAFVTHDADFSVNQVVKLVKQEMAEKAIVITRGNQSKASNMMGMNRATFRTIMRNLKYKKQGNYANGK